MEGLLTEQRLAWAAITAVWFPGVCFAQEARCYELLLLFSALQCVAFLKLLRAPTTAGAAAWAVFTALSILTHYDAILSGAVQGVIYLVEDGNGAHRTLIASGGRAAGLAESDLIAAVAATGLDGEAIRNVRLLERFLLFEVPADQAAEHKPNLPSGPHVYYFPEYDEGVAALPARKAAQLAAARQIGAFHDFQFTDRLPESGITFRHQGTDDSGRDYKAVHYDHGNGLAAADVDGDGLLDLYFVSQLGESQLWKNLGNGKFRNLTAEAGVGLKDQQVLRHAAGATNVLLDR